MSFFQFLLNNPELSVTQYFLCPNLDSLFPSLIIMEYIPSEQNQIRRWKTISYEEPSIIKCFICDYSAPESEYKTLYATDLFHFGRIKRFVCPQCDVIFGDLKFITAPPIEILHDYQDVYSYYNEATIDKFFIDLLQSLKYIQKSQKIIDYGSGNKLKYHAYLNSNGYNISKYDKFVKSDDMISTIVPESFDILFNHNVIEHVINPYEDLAEMIDLIKPKGLLIMSSACWEYIHEVTHYHTFFFLGRSVDYLCKKLKIELIDTVNYFYDGEKVIIKVFQKL